MSQPATPDIDRILGAVVQEANARSARTRPVIEMPPPGPPPAAVSPSFGWPPPEIRAADDFLALPLDVFLEEAYARLVGRAPDAEGASHYQRALLRGRLTRVEVLGRLAFSPEGRKHGHSFAGLGLAFLLATAYRVPVAGPLAALVARLLSLPALLQDRRAIEAAAVATGAWMRR